MSKIITKGAIAMTYLLPVLAFAQVAPAPGTVDTIIGNVKNTLNLVITALAIIATLIFIWGIIQFVINAGSPDKRSEGRQMMINGLIGLAIIAAAWAIANLIIVYFLGPSAASPTQIKSPPTLP